MTAVGTRARGATHKLFAPPSEWRQHHNGSGRPKIHRATEGAAVSHAHGFSPPLSAYRCPVCDGWHVGLTRNRLAWMADSIIDELELGTRVVAHLRREAIAPRGAIGARGATADRIRGRA